MQDTPPRDLLVLCGATDVDCTLYLTIKSNGALHNVDRCSHTGDKLACLRGRLQWTSTGTVGEWNIRSW